ncbi:MAG: hypothetical protein E7361_04025 [Clostridiales bacterium]|nr:hypothetical protein [Clostridiales bacterium]
MSILADVALKVVAGLLTNLAVKGVDRFIENSKKMMKSTEPKDVKNYLTEVMKSNNLPENLGSTFAGYCHMRMKMGEECFKNLLTEKPEEYQNSVAINVINNEGEAESKLLSLDDAYQSFVSGITKEFTPEHLLDASEYIPGQLNSENVYADYFAKKVTERENVANLEK